jgi:alpha-ribazole phosphatase/probable phosphoglycerate mutase
MLITLLRHGEVDENFIGAYNGHNNISLSKRGYKQAKELAEHFKQQSFDAYFCSDLLRARQTFAPFKKDAIYTSKLREKSWGRHEGMNFDEICKQDNIRYESFEQWLEALDGEDYLEFIKRVKKFFFEELVKYEYQNIFIMTHSGVIKVFIHLVSDISLQEAFGINLPYAQHIIFDTISNSLVMRDMLDK